MAEEMSEGEEVEQTFEERAAARAELEPKTTEELFAGIREMDEDDDAAWSAVTVLRVRGTSEVFQLAKEFSQSENPKERASGLRVLAQLGAGRPDAERPFMAESVAIAISHLNDPSEEVVRAAAWALSWLHTKEAIPVLLGLGNHPDPDVRWAVAFCNELHQHDDAIPTIIKLTEDEDDEVRDWATFNLGSFGPFVDGEWRLSDSPEIRAALHRRLDDTYEEARREAIWGLAQRHDPDGLRLLLEHLESEDWWSGDETAAEETLGVATGTPVEELCHGLRELLARNR